MKPSVHMALIMTGTCIALLGCAQQKTQVKDAVATPKAPTKKAETVATEPPSEARAAEAGKTLYELWRTKRFAEAAKRVAPEAAAVFTEAYFAKTFAQLHTLGKPTSLKVTKSAAAKARRRIQMEADYPKFVIHMLMMFDAQGRLAGLHLKTPRPKFAAWKPPPYAKIGSFTETKLTVESDVFKLPAVLTLPKGDPKTKVPVVVLVHGSGPQDMDESAGPNKIFKDLAWGLASRGIGVLRYHKVTHAEAAKWIKKYGAKADLDNEVADHALQAVALARRQARVDPARIILAGHSQGGRGVIRVAERDPKVAGVILLAGPAGNLADGILRQYEYIAGAGGAQAKGIAKLIPAMRAAVKEARSPSLTVNTPAAKLPLGMPATVWLFYRTWKVMDVTRKLPVPMLILQGEADYQVTMKHDFALWKKGLAGRKRTTFKSYPQVNHGFLNVGKAMSLPLDGLAPAHMFPKVVGDIVAWVKAVKP